jgi:subtilisin family serine protease
MAHPLQFSRWARLAVALVCAVAVVVARPDLPGPAPDIRAAGHEASADSTPDASSVPDEPYPARQRTRLLARMGVERWHHLGSRGQGVKVAILDTGFHGYRAHLGEALPARVTTRSFRADGNLEAKDSQHGILCGEVIHALAPDAELLLANWEADRPDQFLAAARWARQQGAQVISCSVIMPSWSDGEGSGPVHAALSRILGAGDGTGDVLCFASAGNTAQRHWSGPFHAGSQGFHEWVPGERDNTLTPWGTEPVSVELCWQGGANYDLAVNDAATGVPVSESPARAGVSRSCAVARFMPRPGHGYRVRVRAAAGRPGSFHLAVLGSGLGYATAHGSIPFPGDGPEVIAVGAVDTAGKRTSYSSCGPNSPEPKPDLVATVPFPSLWRPRPFAGTSAAAPQAAALAALVWSHSPQRTANQVRQALHASAQDLGPAGHDYETGYGLIALPRGEELQN